jgi:hypothetical protein
MKLEGQAVEVEMLEDGIAELRFDLKGDSVNKFNRVDRADPRGLGPENGARRARIARDERQRLLHRRRRRHRVCPNSWFGCPWRPRDAQ